MNRLAFAVNASVIIFSLAWLSFPHPAYAKRLYGRAGCGLGSMLFKPSGNQSSAWTSNSSSGNQLFGITSGTSNCIPTNRTIKAVAQEQFITTNLAMLAKDMARGEGETLVAFTNVLGCPNQDFPAVAAQLKGAYSEIFAAPGALAVLDASKDHLLDDPALAHVCAYLL